MPTRAEAVEAIQTFQFRGIALGDAEDQIEAHFDKFAYDEGASNPSAQLAVYEVVSAGVDKGILFFVRVHAG